MKTIMLILSVGGILAAGANGKGATKRVVQKSIVNHMSPLGYVDDVYSIGKTIAKSSKKYASSDAYKRNRSGIVISGPRLSDGAMPYEIDMWMGKYGAPKYCTSHNSKGSCNGKYLPR